MSPKSASAIDTYEARPVRFDRRRLIEALTGQRKLLFVVGVLALFGGGLVAKLSVPLDHVAEIRVTTAGQGELLSLASHGPTQQKALGLARSAGEQFIREANASLRRQRAAGDRAYEQTRREVERARASLAIALAGDGIADLQADAIAIDTRIRDQEAARSALLGEAVEAATRADVLKAAASAGMGRRTAEELATTQRALSVALAQETPDSAKLKELHERIQRLLARSSGPLRASVSQRAATRAHEVHVAQVDQELEGLRAERAKLLDARTRHGGLIANEERARARLSQNESNVRALALLDPQTRRLEQPRITRVEGRALRAAVAIVTPSLALFLTIMLILLNEVRDLRISSPGELAYWMRLPVIATSRWPGDPGRLEGLIDALSEDALEARGTTLVLAGSESEQPLASTIVAQLNARAQRHFRSATGARVTVAQAWQGELSGPHLRRATEAADRVLWVVSAGSHRGPELRVRRADIPRAAGVAALLVDAPHRPMSGQIGDPQPFWASESSMRPEPPAHSERLPLYSGFQTRL